MVPNQENYQMLMFTGFFLQRLCDFIFMLSCVVFAYGTPGEILYQILNRERKIVPSGKKRLKTNDTA